MEVEAESSLSLAVSPGSPPASPAKKTFLQRRGEFAQIVVEDEDDWVSAPHGTSKKGLSSSSGKKEGPAHRASSSSATGKPTARDATILRLMEATTQNNSVNTSLNISGNASRGRSSFGTNFGDEVHSIHSHMECGSDGERERETSHRGEREEEPQQQQERAVAAVKRFSVASLEVLVESQSMREDSSLDCQSIKNY